jgi:hypothetical protein
MKLLLFFCCVLLCAACQHRPPSTFVVSQTIAPGSTIQMEAQTADQRWHRVHTMKNIPSSLTLKEVEKWTISAAQQRLGKQWKDYRFRIIPPERHPVLLWQRAGNHILNPRP